MDVFPLDLDQYHVSTDMGFLMSQPLEVLPEYFQPWNKLAAEVHVLAVQNKLRDAVDKLEILDHTRLKGYKQLSLAHLQLSFIAAGYVWQGSESEASRVLPRCIAVPLCAVADLLGIKPIVSHCTFVLSNVKLNNNREFDCLYQLPGGNSCRGFITLAADVELAFADGFQNLLDTLYHAERGNEEQLIDCLHGLSDTIKNVKNALTKAHKTIDPKEMYESVRPLLSGWNKGSALPDGIIYQGVSDKPMQVTGGSGAQSSALHCLDVALGITHRPERQSFLDEMRNYMPPAHKRLVETIQTHSKVRAIVLASDNEKLTDVYNSCVKGVADYRSYHIQLVSKYVSAMACSESTVKQYKRLATHGTAGTSIFPLLKSLRDTSREAMRKSSPQDNQ